MENPDRLKQYDKFIVCGMGASALAGDLLRIEGRGTKIKVWRDYGLPETEPNTLIIACSYAGNTEETLDSFHEARQKHLPVAAVTMGGQLLILAKQHGIPYIQLPDTGIHARMAAGFSAKALMKLVGSKEEGAYQELSTLQNLLDVEAARVDGETLANDLRNKIPIICASSKNFDLAYNWKVKLNEVGRIPAFASQFPELNHNEMTGFDSVPKNKHLSEQLVFVFLEDEADDPRILKRMEVCKKMYQDKELAAYSIKITGKSFWQKIFQNLLVGDWTAFYLGQHYGANPDATPMAEEFGKLIK